MRLIATLFIAALLSGCATKINLTKKGESVSITKSAPNGYELVGAVDCNGGWALKDRMNSVRQCYKTLRNRAAELKADIVVINHQMIGNMECANCVYLSGLAYKKN